ncbi:MAG TPA: glycosyltransferase [bacterium]|nr:glycosyltransferase [bacterium]
MLILSIYWWSLVAYLLFVAWDNTLLFEKPPALDKGRKKWPFVSILIPARNEELRIEPCLKTLLALDYPRFELIVLDDRSTDGTLALLRKRARKDHRLKVISGTELPPGWKGKPWACQQLAKKAKGEWFFFTDADTWHHPHLMKRSIQMALAKKADVLTLFTRQVTGTWMEALVVPVMAYTLLAFLPARWSLRKDSFFSKFAGVSGQYILIQKKVYRAFGGHERVKNEIVEDLNFGKLIVRGGYKLVYGDGSDLSFCRMYTNAREVWEGFSKNFYSAVAFNPLFFLNAQAALLLDGVAPFVALCLGPDGPLFGPALAMVLVSFGVRALESFRYGFSRGSVLFHPLGCLLFSLIGFNSVFWHLTGRGHWKGRKI